MRRIRTLLFASLLSLPVALQPGASLAAGTAPAAAEADPTNTAELVAAIEKTYASVTSLRADFAQVSKNIATGTETRQKGRVMLKRPKKMRWDFTGPEGSSFVTDGTTMWVWSQSTNQVIVSSAASAGSGSGMTQLLDDLNQLDELFVVTLVDGAGNAAKSQFVVDLVPRKEAGFKKLRITFTKKKYTVEQVNLTDLFDNTVELSFSQVRMNQTIEDAQFNFQVPAGATVIRADGQ